MQVITSEIPTIVNNLSCLLIMLVFLSKHSNIAIPIRL